MGIQGVQGCSEGARTLRDKNTDVTSVCSYVIS